jgi:hypothetical protein
LPLKFLTLSAVLVLPWPQPANADAGWTDYALLAELTPTARHYYQFRLPVRENPGGCRDEAGFYQDYGTPGSEQMYLSLLEALRSGLRVRVYVTGKCNLDGYAEVSAVSVKN